MHKVNPSVCGAAKQLGLRLLCAFHSLDRVHDVVQAFLDGLQVHTNLLYLAFKVLLVAGSCMAPLRVARLVEKVALQRVRHVIVDGDHLLANLRLHVAEELHDLNYMVLRFLDSGERDLLRRHCHVVLIANFYFKTY